MHEHEHAHARQRRHGPSSTLAGGDVLATLQAVEGDAVRGGVGPGARGRDVGPDRGHRQHASAGGDEPAPIVERGPRMQDRDAGRPMELDAILGALVEMGRLADVDTPRVQALLACLRLIETRAGATRAPFPNHPPP